MAPAGESEAREVNFRIRDRDIVVQAFQLTAEQLASRKAWPEWLRTALPRMKQGVLRIRTPHGVAPVNVDDWVIRDKNGALWVQTPAAFEQFYSQLEGS